jgi:hypothetical protein
MSDMHNGTQINREKPMIKRLHIKKVNGLTKGDAVIPRGPRKGEIVELKYKGEGKGSFLLGRADIVGPNMDEFADKWTNRLIILQYGPKQYWVVDTLAKRKILMQPLRDRIRWVRQKEAGDPELVGQISFSYGDLRITKTKLLACKAAFFTSAAAVRRFLKI